MKYTKDFYDRLLKNDDQAWIIIIPTLKRCAKAGASKSGADHLVEDVYGELLRVFFSSLLSKIDHDYNIEPILIETSRRIGLTLVRNEPFENSVGISASGFDSLEHFERYLMEKGASIEVMGPDDETSDVWVKQRQQKALKRMGLA
jgi:hypothetical protein